MQKDLRNTIIAIVITIIASVVAGYMDYDTNNDLQSMLDQNKVLEENCVRLETTKGQAQLDELTKQLKELNENFANYVKILPSAEVATEERLRRTVQGWCDAAGLEWENLDVTKEKPKPGVGAKLGEFQETTVAIRATGSFETFVKFLNNLERHEQFFKVNSFSLNPKPPIRFVDNKQQIDLNLSMIISTYTYVPTK